MTVTATSPITFRLAQNNDVRAIINIWRENMIDEMPDDQTLQSCLKILTDLFTTRQDYYNYWVAVDEQLMTVIGWQSYFPVFTTPLKKDTVVESSTYIRKDYHRNGIAIRLMSFALEHLAKSELHFVYGYIKESNIGTQKIVEKLGFVKVKLIPNIAIFPHNYPKLLFIYQIPKGDKKLVSSKEEKITVRLAQLADVPALQYLLNSHLYENTIATERAKHGGFVRVNYSTADFETMIDQQEIVVADCKNAVVGYYLVGHSCANEQLHYQREAMKSCAFDGAALPDVRMAYGAQAVVTPAYRGLGLSRKMLAALAESLMGKYTHLFSSITKSNHKAFTVHTNSG